MLDLQRFRDLANLYDKSMSIHENRPVLLREYIEYLDTIVMPTMKESNGSNPALPEFGVIIIAEI